jgi:glycosyltransferase involved in cell wall biosynthesis
LIKKNERPLVSVVTVVFNGEESLGLTVTSVVDQSFDSVEYLIVDGESKDKTVEIAKSYLGKGVHRVISEPDLGIYDAMNKGITLAQGEWVLFLNSGDRFYSGRVLERVFAKPIKPDVGVIYGNHILVYASGREKLVKAGSVKNLWKGSQFCHQSVFVRRELLFQTPFNIKQKLAADYEFFFKMWKDEVNFLHVNEPIAKYLKGGISDVKRSDVVSEWNAISGGQYFFWYKVLFLKVKCVVMVKNIFSAFGYNRWQ